MEDLLQTRATRQSSLSEALLFGRAKESQCKHDAEAKSTVSPIARSSRTYWGAAGNAENSGYCSINLAFKKWPTMLSHAVPRLCIFYCRMGGAANDVLVTLASNSVDIQVAHASDLSNVEAR